MAERIKWDDLTPLNQHVEEYEPQKSQIIQYAKFIGLILPQDNRLLYLAREGLRARLPPFWQACEDANGQLYFRNKKTRVITGNNPLDELYIEKIKQMKQLEANINIVSINQQSAVNQSSGMFKSKAKVSDLRASSKQNQNNSSMNQRILEHHITQQSVYSDKGSAFQQNSSVRSREAEPQPQLQWKLDHELKLLEIKSRIVGFVPNRSQLITNIQTWSENREQLSKIMDLRKAQKLIELRLQVQSKKNRYDKIKRQQKSLQTTLDKLRLREPTFH